jgi:protein TonB
MFAGKRGLALLLVILLHIVVGWGFYTGLAQHYIKVIIPPVEIAQIDRPKQEDKPPPPPPKVEEIKPYVPPPEFVDIAAPVTETTAITQVTQSNTPAPAAPVAAPVAHVRTGVKGDPKHPLKIGEDYYPDASKRAGEEGACIVRMTVAADGRITDASIETTSGFPRLDEACLKGVRGQRMLPATEDGKPIEVTTLQKIVWKLKS